MGRRTTGCGSLERERHTHTSYSSFGPPFEKRHLDGSKEGEASASCPLGQKRESKA